MMHSVIFHWPVLKIQVSKVDSFPFLMFVIDFAMAYYKRGKCYMMMHDYKRALYDFSAAILNETRKSQTIF